MGQVALFDLLKKFDGETVTEVVRPKLARMRYRVTKSPQYLMFHMVRFKKNNFFKEKNPTLGEFLWILVPLMFYNDLYWLVNVTKFLSMPQLTSQ